MPELDFCPQDFSRWQIADINSPLTFLLNFELKESFSFCLRREEKSKTFTDLQQYTIVWCIPERTEILLKCFKFFFVCWDGREKGRKIICYSYCNRFPSDSTRCALVCFCFSPFCLCCCAVSEYSVGKQYLKFWKNAKNPQRLMQTIFYRELNVDENDTPATATAQYFRAK